MKRRRGGERGENGEKEEGERAGFPQRTFMKQNEKKREGRKIEKERNERNDPAHKENGRKN